jgi:hypothetical protein
MARPGNGARTVAGVAGCNIFECLAPSHRWWIEAWHFAQVAADTPP